MKLPSLVARSVKCCVCTTDKNCNPSGATMFYLVKDDKLYLLTHDQSTKIQHIKSNPNVCIVIEDDSTYEQVQIYCRAKIVETPGEFIPDIQQVINKATEESNFFAPYTYIKNEGEGLEVIELETLKIKSFDPQNGLTET